MATSRQELIATRGAQMFPRLSDDELGRLARFGEARGYEKNEERRPPAFERDSFVGDCHVDSELRRLAEGAAHQRHAGDAGREAEVIFNSRRSARLDVIIVGAGPVRPAR